MVTRSQLGTMAQSMHHWHCESEPVENATEQWDAHMLSALGAVDARALRSITTALDRLDHGQFGLCWYS